MNPAAQSRFVAGFGACVGPKRYSVAITVAALWLLLAPGAGRAGAIEAPSIAGSSFLLSKYLDDNATVIHDGAVLQTQLVGAHQSGFYYGVWSSFNAQGADDVDEIDWFLGYSMEVGLLAIDVGIAYYDLYRLFGRSEDDAWVPYIQLSESLAAGIWELQPFLNTEVWMVDHEGALEDGGLRARLGLRVEGEWLDRTWTSRTSLFYEDGLFGLEPGSTFELQVAAVSALGDKTRLSFPTFTLMSPVGDADGRMTQAIVGIGLETEF